MLEQDPGANLNREIPITPAKPQPKQDYQQLVVRMLPELKISCFKVGICIGALFEKTQLRSN